MILVDMLTISCYQPNSTTNCRGRMSNTFYLLQKASNPSIYYHERRGPWQPKHGHTIIFSETSDEAKATKYRSVEHIKSSMSKYFQNTVKGHLVDMSAGVKVIKREIKTVVNEEIVEDSKVGAILSEIQLTSKLINNTHYSAIELYNKIRSDSALSNYKFILSTAYDRLETSKLMKMFEDQGLNPIKHKGNFAFDREEYLTAAKLICDVPFKSFNLTE